MFLRLPSAVGPQQARVRGLGVPLLPYGCGRSRQARGANRSRGFGQPSCALVPAAVPEYSRATKQLKTAKQALTIAEYNAQSLRESFAQGYSSSVITDARKYDPDR
jgi:hypothetical protein